VPGPQGRGERHVDQKRPREGMTMSRTGNQPQDSLRATRDFWDRNPCDGHPDLERRMRFRYRKEPWLPAVLNEVSQHESVLEVGCGQGTDALSCCLQMKKGSSYTALDVSEASIERARESSSRVAAQLNVRPRFLVGNAEALAFPEGAFQCAFSLGVLHHSPDTQRGIQELFRVLRPRGTAYVSLYRLASPKLLAAHFLRGISGALDWLTRSDRLLYGLLSRAGSDHIFGTMLLECVGTPLLRSYTRGQVRRLFSGFDSVQIRPVGIGVPTFGLRPILDSEAGVLGAQWLIVATKGSGGKPEGRRDVHNA
jgi:SAM-dependent methyltransferase